MTNIEKIGKFEVFALFITIISTNIIINIPTIILGFTSTGSWINIIFLTIICLLFIILICKFFKPFICSDILDVSESLGGKKLKIIIGILYFILFLTFSGFCLRYFSYCLQMIYFNNISLVMLMIICVVQAIISAKIGLKVITGAAIIFLPLSILSLFVFSLAAIKYFNLENLLPIFGNGIYETFFLNLPNIFAFNVVSYLYFLKPFIKNEKSYKKISIFAVIMCGIYLFISVSTLLMIFPFIMHTDETLSVYLVTRLISFGRFFQRVDALFVFVWIIIIISFLSLNLFILSYIIKKLAKLKTHTQLICPISALTLAIGLMLKDISYVKFATRYIYRFYGFILVFVISFIIFLFAYIKKTRRKEYKNEIK